jgi:Uma2 family endonuclease
MAIYPHRLMTAEEFEQYLTLPENADRLLELIQGEMIEKVPTQYHALIATRIANALMNYMAQHPLAWVLVEARYKLPDDDENGRVPDVSLVFKVENRRITKQGPAPYMPELAVEIQSPGQSDKLMTDKAAYYLANGSQAVWLLYPDKLLVEVLTADDRRLFGQNDTLTGSPLLPDFSLSVKDLFAE